MPDSVSLYFLLFSIFPCNSLDNESIPVLVLSIDSFRWDFLDRIRNIKTDSFLWKLIEKGAYARDGIRSTFSTTPTPNRYSLVTGLYQESHNVIAHVIFDPKSNRTYDLTSNRFDDEFSTGGEPIWKTLTGQANDDNPKVGCYDWAECGIEWANKSMWINNEHGAWEGKMERVVEWIKNGLKLILLSIPDIDIVGRMHGPQSAEMDDTLVQLDEVVGYWTNKLQFEFDDRFNLIIVSGHGITESRGQPILPNDLDRFFKIWTKSPSMCLIEPKEYNESQSIEYLSQFKHVKVYRKQDIPDDWHYKYSPYVAPILILAEPGYVLTEAQKGVYGYETSVSDMKGTLIGYGPAFISNSTIPSSVSVVDLYQLLCSLLNVNPAPNNGSISNLASFVQPEYIRSLSNWDNNKSNGSILPVIILAVILFLGILIGSLVCYRSGECRKASSIDKSDTGDILLEETNQPRMRKYDSELVILDLDGKEISA